MQNCAIVLLNYQLANQIALGNIEMLKLQFENMLHIFDKVYILSPRDNRKYDLGNKRLEIISVPSASKWLYYISPIFDLITILRLIKKENIKVVRTLATSSGIIGTLASMLTGVPCVCSLHGDRRLIEKLEGRTFPKSILLDFIEPLFMKRAKLVPIISQHIGKYALSLGVPKEKMFYHPNWTNTNIFKPVKKSPHKTKKLVFVGRLVPIKRPDLAIKAMPDILKKFDAELSIAGIGPQEKELKQLVGELNLEKSVKFLGSVEHDKALPKLLADSDVFVAPATAGFTLMEALACGMPIVAANIEWAKEAIKDDKNGLLTKSGSVEDLAKAIIKVLENPKLAKNLGVNARKTAEERFSLDIWKDREIELYKKAISN